MARNNSKKATAKAAKTIRAKEATVAETGRAAAAAVADLALAAGAAVRDDAVQRAENGKDKIADQGKRLANGLHRAAAQQEEKRLKNRLLDRAADSVSSVSEGLKARSFGDMIDDTKSFAHRNPGVVVVGAALAGFALARFVRSSSSSDASQIADARTRDGAGEARAKRRGKATEV